jgi:hypothetical protein
MSIQIERLIHRALQGVFLPILVTLSTGALLAQAPDSWAVDAQGNAMAYTYVTIPGSNNIQTSLITRFLQEPSSQTMLSRRRSI